jgi:peptidyl-prolyl cis-trans isomerase-like protein 2
LDKQHTIFGRVVGGLDVLDKMEAVPTEKKTDKPDREIRILNVDVLVDPYQVYKDRLKNKLEKEANAAALAQEQDRLEAKRNSMGWFGPNVTKAQGKRAAAASNGVGKYLATTTRKRDADELALSDSSPSISSPSVNSSSSGKRAKGYGNFDNF